MTGSLKRRGRKEEMGRKKKKGQGIHLELGNRCLTPRILVVGREGERERKREGGKEGGRHRAGERDDRERTKGRETGSTESY